MEESNLEGTKRSLHGFCTGCSPVEHSYQKGVVVWSHILLSQCYVAPEIYLGGSIQAAKATVRNNM